MTEYIITRVDGDKRQVLGTVQAEEKFDALMIARVKWWKKPTQGFRVATGTRAEIRFARDMEADGILADMEFEELMEGMVKQ